MSKLLLSWTLFCSLHRCRLPSLCSSGFRTFLKVFGRVFIITASNKTTLNQGISACMHTFVHQQQVTLNNYDLYIRSLNISCTKRWCFRGVSTDLWIRRVVWLHSVYEIAVPISWSPQHSWWHLVLAECVLCSRWLCITSRTIFKGDVVHWLFIILKYKSFKQTQLVTDGTEICQLTCLFRCVTTA